MNSVGIQAYGSRCDFHGGGDLPNIRRPLIHQNQAEHLPTFQPVCQSIGQGSMKEETCSTPLRLPPILRKPLSITGLYIPRDNRVYPKRQHKQQSQQAYRKMTFSYQNEHIPAVIRGHQHFGFGGSVLPESVIIEQYYDLTLTKKSNVRLNDQLVPKPTDIDMSKKMIKVDIPREHPYSSHIPRYPAIFPSYRSLPVQPSSASAPVVVWRHHQRSK
ncbi:hypothetical protein ABG768_008449 [Culter alburnus]|uniref:Uncharacterized protein n=1 Tax=Culter alburnus TaxID=194366 RepID=A0AAW1ZIA6_CULAL